MTLSLAVPWQPNCSSDHLSFCPVPLEEQMCLGESLDSNDTSTRTEPERSAWGNVTSTPHPIPFSVRFAPWIPPCVFTLNARRCVHKRSGTFQGIIDTDRSLQNRALRCISTSTAVR